MNDSLDHNRGRSLTQQELGWIAEILRTREEWKLADISEAVVIGQERCDEGASILLSAPEPENASLHGTSGYIGRVCINTTCGAFIEVRLDHLGGRLHELFVLFVDPGKPSRQLPDTWTEVSHEAFAL